MLTVGLHNYKNRSEKLRTYVVIFIFKYLIAIDVDEIL